MAHVEKHAPGSFNWLELATTDQNGAKNFYGALFGWQPQDFPMGDGSYTIFVLDGQPAAACMTLPPEMGSAPFWGIYIAVDNADAFAARATELGGTVLRAAFDVSDFGRMAVIQDPTGAVFSIWQTKSFNGTGITGVNGTLCWADLNTADRLRAKAFYEQLFGWEFVTGKDKAEDAYLHIVNAGKGIGGILPESHRNKHAPPHWLLYFLAADCDAMTAKAQELGARVYAAPMTVGESVRFSVLADPQGAVFALFSSGQV